MAINQKKLNRNQPNTGTPNNITNLSADWQNFISHRKNEINLKNTEYSEKRRELLDVLSEYVEFAAEWVRILDLLCEVESYLIDITYNQGMAEGLKLSNIIREVAAKNKIENNVNNTQLNQKKSNQEKIQHEQRQQWERELQRENEHLRYVLKDLYRHSDHMKNYAAERYEEADKDFQKYWRGIEVGYENVQEQLSEDYCGEWVKEEVKERQRDEVDEKGNE